MNNVDLNQEALFNNVLESINERKSASVIHIQDDDTQVVEHSYTIGGNVLGEADYIILGNFPADAAEVVLPIAAELYNTLGAGTHLDIFDNGTNINLTLSECPNDLAVLVEDKMSQLYVFHERFYPNTVQDLKVVQICWYSETGEMGDYEILNGAV